MFAGAPGPVRDAVVLNAGMALAVAAWDDAEPVSAAALTAAVRAGVDTAAGAIDSGAATDLLARWVEVTRSFTA